MQVTQGKKKNTACEKSPADVTSIISRILRFIFKPGRIYKWCCAGTAGALLPGYNKKIRLKVMTVVMAACVNITFFIRKSPELRAN